ncbi:hypothetical protein JCM8547_000220 [Rhodosporidiobolus lusitaniae]
MSSASLSSLPAPVVLSPPAGTPHTGTIIFSHGLGDSANGWLGFGEMVRRKWAAEEGGELRGVKWMLTNAPERTVTANGGAVMPAWFDVIQFRAPPELEDVPGLLSSSSFLRSMIQSEIDSGVPAEKIVVGGFSQGGVLSLLTGLTHPEKLGGIVALSAFLPLTHEDKIKSLVTEESMKTPLFWAHGTSDPVILHSRFLHSRKYLLEDLGWADAVPGGEEGEMKGDFTIESYGGMQHELGAGEMEDLVRWLEGRFK